MLREDLLLLRNVKDIKDVVMCVVDLGTFFPVAMRLSRDCKKVFYCVPNGEASRTFAASCRGDGHAGIERIDDFWPHLEEIDTFVFPDCGMGGLQLELERQGKSVWGSKNSGVEEEMRGKWIKTCEKLGLPMPKTHVIKGLTNLLVFFREHDGETFHVKISRFRGDMETWKATELAAIENKIRVLWNKFGPWGDDIKFYVQEPVETDIEGGADSYFVNGQYPDKVILGYEKKGESYFATWKPREEMPPEIWKPSEVIAPLMAAHNYCNLVSTEIRVAEDKSYLLDPCLRFGSPAGEEELELYGNFTEIIYRGAMGELVQPDMAAKFCGEAIIGYCGDKDGWKSIEVPQEVEQWVKLYACGCRGGAYHFPPSQDAECIGCVVGLGDTPEEVLDHLKEVREALGDAPVDIKIEPLVDLFDEIEKAEKQGIEFSEKSMPDPAEVVTES